MNIKKVDFIERLIRLRNTYEDIAIFLREEKLIDDNNLAELKNAVSRPKYLYLILEKLKEDDKLELLDYEWVVLPVERLKLSIVTKRVSKEFVFNW
jgi:hypothetical protein